MLTILLNDGRTIHSLRGFSTHDAQFHFPRGDMLIKMPNLGEGFSTIAFKLHRDILTRYSGFFRDLLAKNETLPDQDSESQTISVEGAITACCFDFHKLCEFMYPDPSVIGVFPDIKAGDLSSWRSTIEATIEFDMPSIRAYILTRVSQDESAISAQPISFLKWCTGLGESFEELRLKCYRAFALRQMIPSYTEMEALPKDVVFKLMLAREQVRSLFLDARGRQRLVSCLPASPSCSGSKCGLSVISSLSLYMTSFQPDLDNSSGGPDVPVNFELGLDEPFSAGACIACREAYGPDLLHRRLNPEIERYIKELNHE